jgi:tetratricopeptide (TPR) repeat protein
MKTTLSLIALTLFSTLRATTLLPETEHAIEGAYLRASATSLAAAVQPLDAALAADPKNAGLIYLRAFAHYAATTPLRVTNDQEKLIAELEKAVGLLERVHDAPWAAEADALRGSILGQLIGLKGGMSGMTLGPKSSQLLARAEKALPGNPRVLLFRGISLLNTPAAFGGNPAEGTKLLQQAVEAFAKDDATRDGPHWGRADALTWLGIAKKKTGDLAAARAAWEQALAIEPDYGWVKFALLPSLNHKTK